MFHNFRLSLADFKTRYDPDLVLCQLLSYLLTFHSKNCDEVFGYLDITYICENFLRSPHDLGCLRLLAPTFSIKKFILIVKEQNELDIFSNFRKSRLLAGLLYSLEVNPAASLVF